MQPQARGTPRTAGCHQRRGDRQAGPSPRASRGSAALGFLWVWSDLRESVSDVFKPPSVRRCVVLALEIHYAYLVGHQTKRHPEGPSWEPPGSRGRCGEKEIGTALKSREVAPREFHPSPWRGPTQASGESPDGPSPGGESWVWGASLGWDPAPASQEHSRTLGKPTFASERKGLGKRSR